MKNIKQVVKNKEWQRLRKTMIGTWKKSPTQNLLKLKEYLKHTKSKDKLRRVHNYLAALRGLHNPDIRRMRKQIKKRRF
jgi:hypothetical protein